MSNVTAVTNKPTSSPVRFSGALGQFRTLKNGQVTVALTADPRELKKILELVTACQTGSALLFSAQIAPPKKNAKENPDSKTAKGPRRVRRYPYK